LVFLASCSSTIVPESTKTSVISWDNGEQNGGLIALIEINHKTFGVITPNARDRYNILVNIYFTNFIPPIKFDSGITPTPTNTFLIDAQHLEYFTSMNRWWKSSKNLP